MGLIRKIRESADSWNVRFEEPRQIRERSDAESDPAFEEKNVLHRRKMFGKIFENRRPNDKTPIDIEDF